MKSSTRAPGGATGVAYHNNGSQILTAGADKTALLWETATGRCLLDCLTHDAMVWAAVFRPDGKMIAFVSNTVPFR